METTINYRESNPVLNFNSYSPNLAFSLNKTVNPASRVKTRLGEFKKITEEEMPVIWNYLKNEPGRTTDFSYGGVLMWVDFFNYEYAVYDDTLFIKGVVENDRNKPAFSLPIGKLSLSDSVEVLKEYCMANGLELEFSAVPEYAVEELKTLNPRFVEELTDWADYLYNAEPLSTLKGKKMSKKRNHVNQFTARYPEYKYERLTPENSSRALEFMDIFDLEGDSTEMAASERALSRELIKRLAEGDRNLLGGILSVDGETAAYTIGDVKNDTLFVHVEKATRKFNGSYEMINWLFAKDICENNPGIAFINREDDAGDIGLRMAKESYHPCEMLKKYNILF